MRRIVKNLLKQLGYENFEEAEDGVQALAAIQADNNISIIFADLQMPNMNGMQLLQEIRTSSDTAIAQLPVIMISGHEDSEAAMHAVFDMGATDFIAKPFSNIELSTKAYSYINLTTKLKDLEKKVAVDQLTGISNNQDFLRLGGQALSLARRHKLPCSLCYIEVENLRNLYKKFGRNICEQIIVSISKRIKTGLRNDDIAARVGMSRFALFLPMTNGFKTQICISRIIEQTKKISFETANARIQVSLAAGITTVDKKTGDIGLDELCLQADTALQMAFSKPHHIAIYNETAVAHKEVTEITDPLAQALNHLKAREFEKLMHEDFATLRGQLIGFVRYLEQAEANKY